MTAVPHSMASNELLILESLENLNITRFTEVLFMSGFLEHDVQILQSRLI